MFGCSCFCLTFIVVVAVAFAAVVAVCSKRYQKYAVGMREAEVNYEGTQQNGKSQVLL